MGDLTAYFDAPSASKAAVRTALSDLTEDDVSVSSPISAGGREAAVVVGDSTVIVRSFPQILGSFDGETFFRSLLNDMTEESPDRDVDGRIEELIKIMACRGAVKAGDRLSPQQIKRILQKRDSCEQTDTCPHGRPTSIILSRDQLNEEFQRD